jgi:hypothetical protein
MKKVKVRYCPCGRGLPTNKPFQKYCNWDCINKYEVKKIRKPKCKPLKKKRKKSVKNPLYKLCDDLWSKAVKILAGNKCEYSGRSDSILNSHHMFSRSNKSTRWDVNNGVCLLAQYHTLNSKFSAHKTPFIFQEYMKERRGEKWYEELKLKAHSTIDIDLNKVRKDLEIIIYGKPKELPF